MYLIYSFYFFLLKIMVKTLPNISKTIKDDVNLKMHFIKITLILSHRL